MITTAVLLMGTSLYAQNRRGHRKPPSPEKMIAHLDTDEDGKISKAEAEAAERGKLKEHFDKIDTDGDIYITAEELQAAFDKRRERGKEDRG